MSVTQTLPGNAPLSSCAVMPRAVAPMFGNRVVLLTTLSPSALSLTSNTLLPTLAARMSPLRAPLKFDASYWTIPSVDGRKVVSAWLAGPGTSKFACRGSMRDGSTGDCGLSVLNVTPPLARAGSGWPK